jgi:ubiquinone/menaquinone biosynthesis C-methylase UbiE
MSYANFWDTFTEEQAKNFLWADNVGVKHPARIAVKDWIKNNFKTKPTLLDIPCGSGVDAEVLKSVCKYVGADFTDKMIEAFESHHPTLTVSQEDIRDMKFDDKTFDIVLARGIFEHLDGLDEVYAAMDECYRVAKKVCIFSFCIPLSEREKIEWNGEYYNNTYSVEDVEKIFKKFKPKDIELKKIKGIPYTDDFDIYFLTK